MKFLRCIPALMLCALAACSGGDVKESLGLNKEGPDEFVVVSRPPLALPPDFDLQPPRPGAEPPHVKTTEQQAHDALIGKSNAPDATTAAGANTAATTPTGIVLGTDSNPDKPSLDEFMNGTPTPPKVETAVTPVVIGDAPTPASASFLKRLGAESADTDIRSQLQTDLTTPHDNPDAGSLLEQIEGNTRQETIVDPAKESERLRGNKDDNKAVTEGDTPTIDNSPKSVLDEIKQAF